MAGQRSTLALLLASLVLGCAGGPVDPAPGVNVVLVVVDTLRADYLSVDGFPRPTSPHLERLAPRGVYFERFHAHSAVTRPSVATLFTSRTMSGHGIVARGFGRLDDGLPVIAETLAAAGLETIAVVTNPQVHPALGFDRGFADFRALFTPGLDPDHLEPHDLVKTPAEGAVASVLEAIDGASGGSFFAYLHLLDPHGPYAPPPEHAAPFVDPGYDGRVTGAINDFARIRRAGRRDGADLDHFRDLYLGEIRRVDTALAGLVAGLEARGLAERTHLVITADHGEEFMEHGATGHGRQLYQEAVRVPLLWIGPGVPQGRRVTELAGLIDLAPTILDVLGLEPGPFEGRSLAPLWQGATPEHGRTLLLEGPGGGSLEVDGRRRPLVVRSLLQGRYKVIAHGAALGHPGWEELEIYDLEADPGETSPRRLRRGETPEPGDAALVEAYEAAVTAMLAGEPAPIPEEVVLPPEDVERLHALGYVDD